MITILTSFKPFLGHDATRQRLALISWKQSFPGCEILAFGESGDLSNIFAEYGVVKVDDIPLGDGRVPRADAMFSEAQRQGKFALQFYTNADMIYGPDMARALQAMPRRKYLLVGQRWDWGAPFTAQTADHRLQTVDLLVGSAGDSHKEHRETKRSLESDVQGLQSSVFSLQSDARNHQDIAKIQEDVRRGGKLHGALAMDYFGYRRGDIRWVPPYFVGAAEWDNGMVLYALKRRFRVVDVTPSVVAVHQNHDYEYVPGGRAEVYKGKLAQQNHTIYSGFAGKHYCGVSDATHRLEHGNLQKALGSDYVWTRMQRMALRHPSIRKLLPWRIAHAYCRHCLYVGL